ncbi:MAG: DUF4381 domain-containing protein [Pseudomonadales bacterium]
MQPDPLQQLRDVHLPGLPGWWPPAPGWWLVAMLIAGLLTWLAITLWRSHQQRQPFRTAQRLHQQLCNDLARQRIDTEQYLHEANALLKRTFVHALGEQAGAALTGSDWLSYLNQFVEGEPFSSAIGKLLTESRFAAGNGSHDPAAVATLQQHIGAALSAAAKR